MNQVSAKELSNWINNEEVLVIDVREAYEFEYSQITTVNIPLGEVLDQLDRIPQTGKVVLHCRTGKRAEAIIDVLNTEHGYTNLYNLTGGILAWSEEVDQTKTPY